MTLINLRWSHQFITSRQLFLAIKLIAFLYISFKVHGSSIMEFPDQVQVKEKTLWMANKSVPRNHLIDAHKWTTIHVLQKQLSICTHTIVIIIYTPGLLELNCNTLVKLRYRNGQQYSRILKVSSIALSGKVRLATSLFPKSPRQAHSTARNLSAGPK